jgi:hypothetical protein
MRSEGFRIDSFPVPLDRIGDLRAGPMMVMAPPGRSGGM